MRTLLFTWLPQDTGTLRALPVGFLCGLRFTRSQPVILPEYFARRFAHLIVMLSLWRSIFSLICRKAPAKNLFQIITRTSPFRPHRFIPHGKTANK